MQRTPSRRRDFLKQSSSVIGITMMSSIAKALPAIAGDALSNLSATQAVRGMRDGEIKAEDYARALLDRAHGLKHLNAFRTLEPDVVLAQARDADKRRMAGSPLGSLHGLPIPIKDSVNTASLPTSYGTAALETFRPTEDAVVVRRLRDEGALVMGKTNLHELSFGWTSNNERFGAVRNPYDLDRIPGGSSGGSAAAVAARMAPLAVAEDTWASIRLPAAFCGLAGLRPTYGRYPDDGIMPLTTRFDQVGPVARAVEDLILFDAAVTRDGRPVTALSLNGARIGVSRAFFWDGLDPDVERLANEGLKRLHEAGAVIVEAEVPEIVTRSPELAAAVISYEARPSLTAFLQAQRAGISFEQMFEGVGPNVKGLMEAMALPPNRPTVASHTVTLAHLTQLRAAIDAYFRTNTIATFVFPATLIPPPSIGAETDVEIRGTRTPLSTAVARNMALGSCAGMASLILPAGLTDGGLPVGLEFAALPGQDRALLGLGLSIERALDSIRAPKI